MVKQTPAQALGRSGERWFRALLPKEWIFQAPEEDIGLDGRVIIGTADTTGDLEFGVQIKAKRRWPITNRVISVRGIRRDTVKYWGTRLSPTLIVLYDESADRGYFGWLYDIMLSPMRLLNSPKKTITFKMSADSLLDKRSWEGIRQDVATYYWNLVNSLTQIRLKINTLPTIHSLATALHLLVTAQFETPKNSSERYLLDLSEVTAHKEVIQALSKLAAKFGIEPGSPHPLQRFIDIYRSNVETCVLGFDACLAIHDKPVAVRTNPETMQKVRPGLIRMVSDLIVRLSGNMGAPMPVVTCKPK